MMHLTKARRSWPPRAALFLCALLSVLSARADLLVTSSGESLSGDLTRVVEGILVFRTSLEGQMMLPVSEVKSLTTDHAWVVTDVEGGVHIGRFVAGGMEETPAAEGEKSNTPLTMASVLSAKPVPGQVGSTPDKQHAWETEAGVGVRAFSGTGDGIEPSFQLGTQKRGEQLNTSLQLRFDADGADSRPAYFSGSFEVMGGADDAWAPFVQGRLERDTQEALRVRTGLTVGMRYRFPTSDGSELEGLAGLSASYGEWSRAYLSKAYSREGKGENESTELNAHLGLRYSRSIWGGANWSTGFYVLPGLTDADDFRAGAASSVVVPLTSRLQLRMEMLMNYDRQPAFPELDTLGTSVGASLEWDF